MPASVGKRGGPKEQHVRLRLLSSTAGPRPDHHASTKASRAAPSRLSPPFASEQHSGNRLSRSPDGPQAAVAATTKAATATPPTAPAPLHIQTSVRGRGGDDVLTSSPWTPHSFAWALLAEPINAPFLPRSQPIPNICLLQPDKPISCFFAVPSHNALE